MCDTVCVFVHYSACLERGKSSIPERSWSQTVNKQKLHKGLRLLIFYSEIFVVCTGNDVAINLATFLFEVLYKPGLSGLSSKAGNFNSTQRSQLCQSWHLYQYETSHLQDSRNVFRLKKHNDCLKIYCIHQTSKSHCFATLGKTKLWCKNRFISNPLVIIFLHYECLRRPTLDTF